MNMTSAEDSTQAMSHTPISHEGKSHNREYYQSIVFAFSDLLIARTPPIGDCSDLPYPKKTILYAIEWLMDYWESESEATSNQTIRDKYDNIRPTLSYLLTVLARDWQEIDPQDKDAIAELGKFDSFPDWALPLKLKYINDDRARGEALDAAIQVIVDKVAAEKRNGADDDPADSGYESHNKVVTKEMADAALKRLRDRGFYPGMVKQSGLFGAALSHIRRILRAILHLR